MSQDNLKIPYLVAESAIYRFDDDRRSRVWFWVWHAPVYILAGLGFREVVWPWIKLLIPR